jgi:integrase
LGEQGAALIQIQELLGHEDSRTTMRYVGKTEGGKRASVNMLPILNLRPTGTEGK